MEKETLNKEEINATPGSYIQEPRITGSSRINLNDTERLLSIGAGILLFSLGLRKAVKLNPLGLIGAGAGLYLANRGASGHCALYAKNGMNNNERVLAPLEITETIVVNRPRNEVYYEWRKLENLPRFMKHLKKVEELDRKRSRWEAYIPGTLFATIKWEAEITEEREGEVIAWKSVYDAVIDNSGRVSFKQVGNSTEITATISYRPPAGEVGKTVARYFNSKFEELLRQDLLRFKHNVERFDTMAVNN